MARTRGWLVSVSEGAWSASEAIGRFAIIVFATPMALVMKMREAAQLRKRALSEASPQPAMLIVDIAMLQLPRLVFPAS